MINCKCKILYTDSMYIKINLNWIIDFNNYLVYFPFTNV